MDSDRLNRWLTLGANVGVLVGIIFLAIQIRQNSDLARLHFAADLSKSSQEGELALFGDRAAYVWEKSVLDPASLSLGELRIIDAYFTHKLWRSARVFELERNGLIEPGSTQKFMQSNLSFFFGTKIAKVWWEIEGKTWDPPEFVQLADPIIREIDDDEAPDKLLRIQREVASEIGSSQ